MANRRKPSSSVYYGERVAKPHIFGSNLAPEIRALFELNGQGVDQSEWLYGVESSIAFLKANETADRIVIYAAMRSVLIHAVLAPLRKIQKPNHNELSEEFPTAGTGWSIEYSPARSGRGRVYLASSMDYGASDLRGGEKLVFRRSWAGRESSVPEINQKLVHALDLHYVDERSAFCRIDDVGDIENVITIYDAPSKIFGESILIVTIKSDDLYEYARLSKLGLVFFYDFTRVSKTFSGWLNQAPFRYDAPHLFYHGATQLGAGSYLNGRQIVIPPVTLAKIVKRYRDQQAPKRRSYATYKAINLRTGKRIEVSCNPAMLSNYFQKGSLLPLEMSPVFFNAEVLHRYKADPKKYALEERQISCRGAWSLRTYDINEVGQVHTYLRYLGDLPYREQLYWQSFNEWPKAQLSKRAVTTDFRGEVYIEYDPLRAVKTKVRRLDEAQPKWWKPRGEVLAKLLHRPVTTSESEWGDAILALDQLVTEGFVEGSLKAILANMGRPFEKEWRSLKLLEEVLIGRGAEPNGVKEKLKPIRDVHNLRSIVKGHAAPAKKAAASAKAQKEYGSFRAHFEALATGCDEALGFLMSFTMSEDN